MSNITRRDFIKTACAVAVAFAAPIVVGKQVLNLEIEIDQDAIRQAIWIEGFTVTDGQAQCIAHFDSEKAWKAVYATDQFGRRWTTPDGETWVCENGETFSV